MYAIWTSNSLIERPFRLIQYLGILLIPERSFAPMY